MHEFVRQHIGHELSFILVDERIVSVAILARFVMLEAKSAGHIVAQRQQKLILAIVVSAEKEVCFLHQIAVVLDFAVGYAGGPFAVGGDVQVMLNGFSRA